MMKKGLDERQDRLAAKIGERSSYVMFYASAAVIVAELIWKGNFQIIAGETGIFLAGGFTILAGYIKNGIWSKGGGDMTAGQSLMLSIICSGIFSIFYAVAIGRKIDGNVDVTRYAVVFFIGMSLLSFICLLAMGRIARRNREKQEKKYLD